MEDKFVIVRKKPDYKQINSDRAKIYVTAETYETLTMWATLQGKTIVQVAAEAVAFASAHSEIIDE